MPKKRRRPSYKPSLIGSLFKWLFVAGLWSGIFVAGLFAWYAQELPSITKNATFERKASIIVKAADGTVIGRYGDIKGRNIAAEDLPPNLVYAVLAVEDRRFYAHWGIDFTGLARAMVVNLMHGRFVQGGSTITQQLAKNLFLSQERTLKRKIQEAMLALWLEFQLSKDEILSAYLNRVYMGSGAYGVDAAARLYFDKDVKDLSLRECATLAGLLKAPSRFSPLANPGLSRQRTDTVLATMVDAGYITDAQAKSLTSTIPIPVQRPTGGNSERYYADWIVDSLQYLIGTPEEDIVVYTALDPALQKTAQESLVDSISKNGPEKKITQGAVVVMRPTGEVVAMVGGYDYASNQFNRATQALRQPGSSFKPVIYLAALENGWGPDDVIVDEPFTEGKYRPKNFGNEYYGEVTLATALMLSLNTVSVRLTKDIGPAAVVNTARRLGITTKLDENLSLALGTSVLSPLQMASAYAVLANGGLAIQPVGILKIESGDGKLYYQYQPPGERMHVASRANIDTLTGMMQNVIEYGTGQRAKLPWPAYGKTGTSQDSRDAWFIGFTPEIVTAVWMGNDDNSPMKRVTGGSFPAEVWRSVMMEARGKYSAVESNAGYYSDANFENLMSRIISGGENTGQNNVQAPTAESGRAVYRPRTDDERRIPPSSRYND